MLKTVDDSMKPASCAGQGFVFWLLVALGLIGITPCVLLPEWRQYEQLALAEQAEAHRLAELHAVVDHAEAEFDALRDDPAVLARLARRELGFSDTRESVVYVAARGAVESPNRRHEAAMKRSELHPALDQTFSAVTVRAPALVEAAVGMLPTMSYDAVFCDDRTRTIVLLLSFGLISLAFGLFSRSASSTTTGESGVGAD